MPEWLFSSREEGNKRKRDANSDDAADADDAGSPAARKYVRGSQEQPTSRCVGGVMVLV